MMIRSLLAALSLLAAAPACAHDWRFTCKGDEAHAHAEALQWLREASASPTARDADQAAGEKAYQAALALHAQLLAGKPVDPIYESSSHFLTLAAMAASDRTRTLFQRAARDQLMRLDLQALIERKAWAAGLSDNAAMYAFALIGPESCGVDQENTAWLKADLAKNGWFLISRDGPDADNAAWLMAQHADQDLPFQKQILALIEPLVARHESNPRNYAYIYDRVAVNQKLPQRYGTQGRCTEAGTWQPLETEAPGGLDARRASVGLGPEADYIALFHCQKG